MGDGSHRRYNSISTQLVFETNADNSSPILPEEVIVEILLRVPARSLVQLKCICKLWKTLISDPQFAKSHLLRLNSTAAYPHLVSSYRFGIISYNVESLLEDHLTPIEPDFYTMSQDYSILGSCNGLLCLLEHNRQNVVNVILWNPFLNLKSKPSPTLVSPYSQNVVRAYYGFGYDQVNLKYKVLITFFNVIDGFIDIVTGIYSSGQNSWRMIQNFPTGVYGRFPFDKCSGKCVSGTLNWVVKKKYFNSKREIIISFDLVKETYGEVLLPQSDDISNVTLDVLSNCLCLFFDLEKTQFIVWLMKEYGVADSWTKFMIIPHFILTHMPPIFGDPFHSYPVYKFLTTHGVVRQCNLTMVPSFVDPLFISENGIVLVKTMRSRLFLYHARNGNSYSRKLARYNTFLDLQIYRESLVLPQW